MKHQGESFSGQTIELGSDQFVDCSFQDCRLVYDGSPGVAFHSCDFDEARLELTGPAGNTLQFLQNLYHGFGEDGQAVVENLFEQIRGGDIGLGPDQRVADQS